MIEVTVYNYNYPVKDDTRIHPTHLNISKNATVEYNCKSRGATRWFYRHPNVPPIALGETFVIEQAVTEAGGLYYCYGTYPSGKKFFLARTRLAIYGKLI